ncbi:MAG TPA: sulfotransferase [Solirubrobacteraceae bacterium]|nr:sulfotransferase [Solirubrobacteraceae bacterium]
MTASSETDAAGAGAAQGSARAQGRIPDFFIVGHPKSGTTALYEMLRVHPQIFMPELKEPWFLATDMRPRFQPARSGAVPETLRDYMALFEPAAAEQHAGEASSSYLRSERAAGGIAELRADAKIVAILREPASFLRSLHHQMLRDHIETEQALRTAIALEPDRRAGQKIPSRSHLPQMLLYSNHVRYVEQLRRYHEAFGSEQVLVLIYDDFRADNEGTLRRVHRFLGARDDLPVQALDANTTSKRMRSQRLDDLVNTLSVGRGPVSRALKAGVKALTPSDLRSSALRATRRKVIYGKPHPPDEQLMRELRIRFKGEVQALSAYLDRDLIGLWGYDELD